MNDLEISKFAAAAQLQYEVGQGRTHISLDSAIEQLKNFILMDNEILKIEMQKAGYSQEYISEALAKQFKPSINTLVIELSKINNTRLSTIELLKSLTKNLSENKVVSKTYSQFLEYLEGSNFITKHGGQIFISKTLLSIILIKKTNVGELFGAFSIDRLKTDLTNCMPTIKGDNDELKYLGYTKATYVNLVELLIDFCFVDEFDIEDGLIPPPLLVIENHRGLLKSLSSKIDSLLEIGVQLNFADRVLEFNVHDKSEMTNAGFNVDVDLLGGCELVSFYNCGVKPSGQLLNLINTGRVRVVVNHIKVPRGRDFKFESLEFNGALFDDFYRVCASHGDAWIRKENQA